MATLTLNSPLAKMRHEATLATLGLKPPATPKAKAVEQPAPPLPPVAVAPAPEPPTPAVMPPAGAKKPSWTEEHDTLLRRVLAGEAVRLCTRKHAHRQVISWCERTGRIADACAEPWDAPAEAWESGLEGYAEWARDSGLLARLGELRGKAVLCTCSINDRECHAGWLCDRANGIAPDVPPAWTPESNAMLSAILQEQAMRLNRAALYRPVINWCRRQGRITDACAAPWGAPEEVRAAVRDTASLDPYIAWARDIGLMERLGELRGRAVLCNCKGIARGGTIPCHADWLCVQANAVHADAT